MRKKVSIITFLVLSLIIFGGCAKVNNQKTQQTGQPSSQGKNDSETEINQNEINFLKVHEKEIKNYILAGLPANVAKQVAGINIDYTSILNQFGDGEKLWDASVYEWTEIDYTPVFTGNTTVDRGREHISIKFDNYKQPKKALMQNVIFWSITDSQGSVWKQPNGIKTEIGE